MGQSKRRKNLDPNYGKRVDPSIFFSAFAWLGYSRLGRGLIITAPSAPIISYAPISYPSVAKELTDGEKALIEAYDPQTQYLRTIEEYMSEKGVVATSIESPDVYPPLAALQVSINEILDTQFGIAVRIKINGR